MVIISKQNRKERGEAEKETTEGVPEVFSFELESSDLEDDRPETAVLVTKSVALKKVTVAQLKEIHALLHVPLLFQNLCDCDNTRIIASDTFEYDIEELPTHLQKRRWWEILAGVEIELPSGFHPSGVEDRFFSPTNKENDLGIPKKSYLTEDNERIKHPEFEWKPCKDDSHCSSRKATNPQNNPLSEKGSPSNYVRSKLPSNFESHRLKDYFDKIITPDFVGSWVGMTNQRAAAEGAGTRTYKDWAPFENKEFYKMLGLLFANAVSPKPQFKFWFRNGSDSKIFGNDFFANSLDKKLTGGRVI